MKPVIEMRIYRTKPGKRSEFLQIFSTQSIPAHREIGMQIVGPFLAVEDPDVFFFMRAFPDITLRDELKSKFYEGAVWRNDLEARLMPMLDNYDAVLVEDTAQLFTPWAS